MNGHKKNLASTATTRTRSCHGRGKKGKPRTSICERPLRKKMNMNWMPESEVMVR